MIYWLSLDFGRASGGANNGARWGTRWRRVYFRYRWTPIVWRHFRRLESERVTVSAKALEALNEGLAARALKIEELEAEVRRLRTPKLQNVCRVVFLYSKENRDSFVCREATRELSEIGLVPQ